MRIGPAWVVEQWWKISSLAYGHMNTLKKVDLNNTYHETKLQKKMYLWAIGVLSLSHSSLM